jgi:hypothetical protein
MLLQASGRGCKTIAGFDLGYGHHHLSAFPAHALIALLVIYFDPPGALTSTGDGSTTTGR